MDINQATHQKQRLKRVVALCEFIAANTAAVRQDVVVPHDELDVQDVRGRRGVGMGSRGFSTPHVGSETKLGLAIDGAGQVDGTTVLDGTLGVGLDTKVQRVHLAVATSRVAVVGIWLNKLVEGSVLLRVNIGAISGETDGGECWPGTVTDVVVGTTVVEPAVGSHLRAVLWHNVHDRAGVLQRVGAESVLGLLSDGVLDALASLDNLSMSVASECISFLWAEEENTGDNRDGEIFLGKITFSVIGGNGLVTICKITGTCTGSRKGCFLVTLAGVEGIRTIADRRYGTRTIGTGTGVVADQSRERFQITLDNEVVVHVRDKGDTHGRVAAKGEDQWAVLALERHGIELKFKTSLMLRCAPLSQSQHLVRHVDLVEQVPRVQGVLVVTIHTLSAQLILDTLDHGHGNTIGVVGLTLSLALEVDRSIGCSACAFKSSEPSCKEGIIPSRKGICDNLRRVGRAIILEVADTGKVDGDQGLLVDVAVARGGVSQGLTQVGAGTLVKVLEEPRLTERGRLLGVVSEEGHGRLSGTVPGKRSL